MEKAIQYKPIGTAWSNQVVDLILPIQQLEFGVPVTLNDQLDLLDIDNYYQGTGGGFWGAFDGELLVGTIALIAFPVNSGAIRKMFVRKEYRGRQYGVAAELLGILQRYCGEKGIDHLYLGTVPLLKAACRFYEKNGFVSVAKEDLPAAFPLMPVDTLFYHRAL